MPRCPVCGEHAHAALREHDNHINLAGMYRCEGPDGRYYLHDIEWPNDIPDYMLSAADREKKRHPHL